MRRNRLSFIVAFSLSVLLSTVFMFRSAEALPFLNYLASMNSSSVVGNSTSYDPFISGNGDLIAFRSDATNLVGSDTNGYSDIFLKNLSSGAVELISVDSNEVQSNGHSYFPKVTADGRYVLFRSLATNLVSGDTNGYNDWFMRDIQSGTTTLVSQSTAGVIQNGNNSEPTGMSGDGRFVVFGSYGSNLISSDNNSTEDVFLRDMVRNITKRISVSESGSEANGRSNSPSMSCDGRYVVYKSEATNLVVSDTNGVADVFLVDLLTDEVRNITASANGHSSSPYIDCEGEHIVLMSGATNLDGTDTNGRDDVFLYDISQDTFDMVSVSSAGVQTTKASIPYGPSVINGRYVAFSTNGVNLVSGDTNGVSDVFLRDRVNGTTERVSVNYGTGSQLTGGGWQPVISENGKYVAYITPEGISTVADYNGVADVYYSDTGYVTPDPCE